MTRPVLSPVNHRVGDPPVLEIHTNTGAGPAITIDGVGLGAGGGGGALKDLDFKWYTAGNMTLASTDWVDIPVAENALDIVLDADANDLIEVGISWVTGGDGEKFMDVATLVGGEIQQVFSTDGGAQNDAGGGITAWRCFRSSAGVGGAIVVQISEDSISAGTVTLRLRCRAAEEGDKTILGDEDHPFHWYAKNLGPPPNEA